MDRFDGESDEKNKLEVNSQMDSGFLSGSNLMSSQLSIDSDDEREQDEPKVAPEPAKAIHSGLDLGLGDDLNRLTLKDDTEGQLDVGKDGALSVLDSGIGDACTEDLVSEEEEEEEEQQEEEEEQQEPWTIYYMQDDDGDT